MNLKEVILGIAILVLTMFVTTYGVNIFYSEPQYEDYCGATFSKVPVMNESACFELGGIWNPSNSPTGEVEGYCDQNFVCNQAYELNRERYSMNIFLVAVPLGILLILAGAYFFSLNAVGVGIMAGGVGTILRGVSNYWRYSEDWIRFLISLVGLVIVIFFSYRFGEKLGFSGVKKKKNSCLWQD